MNRFGTNKAVVILLWFGDKILLTQRRNVPHFKGYWAAVGGSVEPTDTTLARAASRELQEETDIFVRDIELDIVDCWQENDFKCFIFQTKLSPYRFGDVKNTEPKKHSPWQLFTVQEALKLKPLMPALLEYLLKIA